MVQHMSQTDGGGGEGGRCSIMEKFFLVTMQGPVTSTFCTYCGDWVKCT